MRSLFLRSAWNSLISQQPLERQQFVELRLSGTAAGTLGTMMNFAPMFGGSVASSPSLSLALNVVKHATSLS